MATLTDFYVKQHDTREPIQIVCQKSDGTAENLTGATAKFIMTSTPGITDKVNASATPVDLANGIIKYQWLTGDTDTPGNYLAEFQVTFSDARILTYPNTTYITVHVIADLGS